MRFVLVVDGAADLKLAEWIFYISAELLKGPQ